MLNQNDISKRHQNDIVEIQGFFNNPYNETIYTCAQKSGKISAAIHMIADIMDTELPLAYDLRAKSLSLVTTCFRITRQTGITTNDTMMILLEIDTLMTLVDIGMIARSISKMNGDILRGELTKVREIIIDLMVKMKQTESSFVLSQYAVQQPVIHDDVLQDSVFESKLKDLHSKRHQNDIKTTLIRQSSDQNDIQNDIDKNQNDIKTTLVNDMPRIGRQKDILNLIKSTPMMTPAMLKIKIPDCSEKTIQRELATLLEMGLIRKEGNKRWTTYRAV